MVLILCRVMNYGVMILSPVVLVRVFELRAYGQYLEFMLYATLIAGVIQFTVNTNLIYFIPKYPDRERQSVTHTALLILCTSVVGLIATYLFKSLVFAKTSFDFVLPLIVYVFFFLNLDFLENYWLGKKRTDYVLYFSSGRVVVRTVALIVAALASRDVTVVIWTMIAVEAAKCLFVFIVLRGIFTRRLDRSLLKEQLRFIVPLGAAGVLSVINSQLANLFISIKMGVEHLAFYRIGGQQIPVINIVRTSVMDVLFPEMAQVGDEERLHLWRRANVVFCAMVFPVFAVFSVYATTFIETLFTATYLRAVPLFRIYLVLIIIQCFEMGTPLRAINQNKYFIFGMILDLAVNIGLILLLFQAIGFVLPALAFILAEAAMTAYMASKILHFYRISLGRLLLWRRIFAILACAVIALPALVAGLWIDTNPVIRAVTFSLLYLLVYCIVLRRFRIDEVELLTERLKNKVRNMRTRLGERGARTRER
jgi:O-antigen/teichoic acid export membrane protein